MYGYGYDYSGENNASIHIDRDGVDIDDLSDVVEDLRDIAETTIEEAVWLWNYWL